MKQDHMFDMPACMISSVSTEWYTPAEIIEAARLVMGSIDVDPASSREANEVVGATTYYTKEQNGFTKVWPGTVWMNPPYGYDDKKPNQARWTARLIEQYQAGIVTQAITLVNAKMSDKWFQPLYDYPICFPRKRVNFWTPGRVVKAGMPHSSAIVYLGHNIAKFYEVFHSFGRVVRAYEQFNDSTLWGKVS